MKFRKIYLWVMDFNTVTVHTYEIEKEEMESISNEIDAQDEDETVVEFFTRKGHNQSEVEYMYTGSKIEIINH